MKKRTKDKKPMKRRTKFTLVSMFNIIWYTIVVLWASFNDHVVQSELTIAWFAAWTTELALLYGIKVHEKYNDSCCEEDECCEENIIDESECCCEEDPEAQQSDSFNEICDID